MSTKHDRWLEALDRFMDAAVALGRAWPQGHEGVEYPECLPDFATVTSQVIDWYHAELGDIGRRVYLFDGEEVTYNMLAAVNEPEVMTEIRDLERGETVTLGQCDTLRRLR